MCGCYGHEHGAIRSGCPCCCARQDPESIYGWDVTFDLGIRGTYTVFAGARDQLAAVAQAALEANKNLAHGYYIDGVKVTRR